jgi:hypothetical protein
MADLLPIPTSVPEAVSTGYQRQNTNFNAVTVGHINLGLTNINTSGQPKITEGSVIEVGGGIYRVTADETIGDWGIANNATHYIYCAPNGGTAAFFFALEPPTWSSVKGGWYIYNTHRAVAKFFYTDGQFNGKVILDSYNAIRAMNMEQPIPNSGGALVSLPSELSLREYTLEPGAYRIEIKGRRGGNGGVSGPFPGGAGGDGEVKSKTVRTDVPLTIKYLRGRDGANGANGGTSGGGTAGGGGGGSTGGDSLLLIGNSLIVAEGGNGGAGASYWGGGGGGGGGGGKKGNPGGDGTAPAEDPRAGKGGNSGKGGNGGSGGAGGGGGGGGSEGYGGYGGSGLDLFGTNPPGGTRGESSDQNGGNGGNGNNRHVGFLSGFLRYIGAGGGAGAGGDADGADGGNGGSGLSSSSSGYVNIYRQW